MTNNRQPKKIGSKPESNRDPVAFRLPRPMIQQLDAMASRRGIDRSALLFELLECGFLHTSIAEIIGRALQKIELAKRADESMFNILDDINDRLEMIEKAIKKSSDLL